jgi:hypothetical protein
VWSAALFPQRGISAYFAVAEKTMSGRSKMAGMIIIVVCLFPIGLLERQSMNFRQSQDLEWPWREHRAFRCRRPAPIDRSRERE